MAALFVAVRLTSDGSVPVLLESSVCTAPGLAASLLRGALAGVCAAGLSTGVLHSVEVERCGGGPLPVFLLAPSGKALVCVGATGVGPGACQAAVDVAHLAAALVHDTGV
jgi:hypothetical protein